MQTRAALIVTGTEVLTGRVTDANGPWVAEQLRRHGVDLSQIVIVGDRAADLARVLRQLTAEHDLVITTGGLGPTADDLTAEVVADVHGRPGTLDPGLRDRIERIIDERLRARGRTVDPAALRAGVEKQAVVPAGASVLEPVGTAPGLVVPPPAGSTLAPVLVLPGPPAELQAMWPAAMADPLVLAALGPAAEITEHTLRLWGVSEPDLAATLRRHDHELTGLEVTTCLRDGEIEVVSRFVDGQQQVVARLGQILGDDFGHGLYSPTGSTVDELVARHLLEQAATIATGESCTAGLLAARIADRAGSSAYLLGGAVTYSNEAKSDLLQVPAELIDAHGAVSEPVAHAMAAGARDRFGATIGVGITGIAGPDGGTADKPVGLVHLAAASPERSLHRRVVLPGPREAVRRRAVVVALHLVRVLLAEPAAQP